MIIINNIEYMELFQLCIIIIGHDELLYRIVGMFY